MKAEGGPERKSGGQHQGAAMKNGKTESYVYRFLEVNLAL